jgi:diacylglycerol kinase family enzyme
LRVVALLGPRANESVVKKFELPGINIFTGNDLDPSDRPGAALIFGGDGTLHNHLAALVEGRTPFLHVPMGSGNDFARSVGIFNLSDALTAWRTFISTGINVREIDAGTITQLRPAADTDIDPSDPDAWANEIAASERDPANHLAVLGPKIMESQLRHLIEQQQHLAALPAFYCCVAGTGFDSEANRRANNLPAWLRRHGGYIIGAAGALFSYKPRKVTVSVPAQKWAPTDDGWVAKFDERCLLVAVGNGPSYGGGMRLTARAEMDDGKLDICFVRAVGKFTILRFFRTVFAGTHLKLRPVEYFQSDRLRLDSDRPMPIYADGEYICDTPVEFSIIPRALRSIVPAAPS